jgi:glycosyltransferase involved in cell wall biosynthesis
VTVTEAPPLVSVVMPSYQKARFIGQAIESVLAQTYPAIELIVVDSSTDDTPQVLERFGERIRVLRAEPRGISAARNAGIQAAKGKYIAFLDADDTWDPSKLEKQVALLERNSSVGLVCADVAFFDEQGVRPGRAFAGARPRAGMVLPDVFTDSFLGTLTVVARRECFDDVGMFDETITAAEDHDMWLRISRKWAVDFVDEPLAEYRYSPDQASADRPRTLYGMAGRPDSGLIRVQERAYSESPELRALDRAALDRGYFNLYLELAELWVAEGKRVPARAILARHRRARGLTPRALKLWVKSWLP